MPHPLAVVVPTPAHSSIPGPLSYLSELPLAPGTLVRVPLGKREVLGVVWDDGAAAEQEAAFAPTRSIAGTLEGVAPLDECVATTCYILLRVTTNADWAKLRSRRCRRSCATSLLSSWPGG